jgi:integrase
MSRVTLHEYAREWIERYQGNGRRGFREETRDEYRRLLKRYTLTYFPPRLRLGELTPRMVAEYIGSLVAQPCRLGAARLEREFGRKPTEAELCERLGTLSETMELVVELVPPAHRAMFALLAATGLNRSELLALEGRHLHLRGERPYVSVRQRVRRQKGKGLVVGPLKSRHRRRDLPIPIPVADQLAALGRAPGELLFQSGTGTLLDPDNLHERVLRPACEEAGVEWAGFHTRPTSDNRWSPCGSTAGQHHVRKQRHPAARAQSSKLLISGENAERP